MIAKLLTIRALQNKIIYNQLPITIFHLSYFSLNLLKSGKFFFFRVVSKSNSPSVLIELGFLTNPEEAQSLLDPIRQKEVAQKIYRGLALYRKHISMDN